ncbi:MAG: hypothetical protein ACYS17_04940 [Planctomycetota bacterium]|jgi:hypothetical protein
MMFGFRSLIAAVCLFGCLFVVFGCQKKPSSEDAGIIPDNLSIAALQTHARYMKAVNSGEKEPSDEISKKYWTDEIKRLNSIKVYMHRANIVVVQKATNNRQEGLYINIVISSYLPHSGDDGFTFTDLGNSVYRFERVIEN